MKTPIITLLTDFGLEDAYVASMKGVILGICPEVRLVDISHLVPPQDIRAGAFLLASVYRDFPPGTIHLAVIDPGVGTARRGLAIQADRYLFVGPDNGLFSLILAGATGWQAFSLEDPAFWRTPICKTFHGRDIFAPVAAHLGMRTPPQALGPPCTPHLASWAEAAANEREILGEIIHIDHFGNAITNVSGDLLARFASGSRVAVRIKTWTLTAMVDAYGEKEPGAIIVLIGSSKHLEIAVNQGSAAVLYSLHRGDRVTVVRLDEEK